jgi:hypothetical protein
MEIKVPEPLPHIDVIFSGKPTYIEKIQTTKKVFSLGQVTFDHGTPLSFDACGDLGIAIAWEVDDISLIIHRKEVDQLCASGCAAHFDERTPVEERVHEG